MSENYIRVEGLKPFMDKVDRRNQRLKNMAPAYKRAVVLYHGWILRNFNAQGRLHENSALHWKPLAQSTKDNRRGGGGGAKILMDTGRLRRDWELRSASDFGLIRSKVDYAAIHEKGGKTKPRVIRPKRAKALRWVSGGVVHFAKSVNHPGSEIPQRKIFPETKQAYKIIMPAFEAHLDWNRP